MSNLTLPSMKYSDLLALVPEGRTRKIGYETLAAREGDTVTVYHHRSIIASLDPSEIYITNAGYGSSTTRARIHAILVANVQGFSVGQQNYDQVLTNRRGDKPVKYTGFRSAIFLPVGDGYELGAVNGQRVTA